MGGRTARRIRLYTPLHRRTGSHFQRRFCRLGATSGEETCLACDCNSGFLRRNFNGAVDGEELVMGWQSVLAILEQLVPESVCSRLVRKEISEIPEAVFRHQQSQGTSGSMEFERR